ncbi:hypothetical protein A7979_02935 [Rothia nasimurium]|uniref:DUF2000 domain-containing protein n=1 Tax=Rothia nasimurium TaxID=85336 RepID=A0A1Y1RP58_9MICC|nr:DUF2000 domain-containing protein [Rothia nasimurium]ORC17374.1 hypothetical protein A7979_02935 [Rothia nasimurium]
MSAEQQKTVILVDRHLPTGLAINAASIVAAMITTAFPALMGPPVRTADSELPGVVLAPLPVLAGDRNLLGLAWDRANHQNSGIDAFPFTRLAQGCKTYDEYTSKLSSAVTNDLELAAIGLCGPKKSINSLTGDLPLYPAKER